MGAPTELAAPVRHSAPDIARGLMLLLIATANISYWLPISSADSEQMHLGDQLVTLIRIPMADQAAYPLFSILLGFGIAVLARRYESRGLAAGVGETKARADAVRTLRLRGMILLCFGAALGLFFTAEILGTYGLVTVLVASLVVYRRRRLMIGLGCLVVALNVAVMLLAAQLGNPAGITTGPDPTSTAWGRLLLENVSVWLVNAIFAVPLSLVVPAVLIGVWLAGTDLLSTPQRHRGLLLGLSALGALAAAGAVPFSLYVAGFTAEISPWALATLSLGGLLTGIGWLALISLGSSYSWVSESWVGRSLAVLGRNSLTGYVAQIVLMAAFAGLMILGGSWHQMSAIDGFFIAVLIWAMVLVLCDAMHMMGRDRPAERLLRRMVSRLR